MTKKCVPKTSDTHSLCPPDKPFWNDVTYSCDECDFMRPYYDPVRKVCRVCDADEVYNNYTKQCESRPKNITCASDEIYNSQSQSCQKRGTTSMCPPSSPYWDSINFKCTQCPSNKPSFN